MKLLGAFLCTLLSVTVLAAPSQFVGIASWYGKQHQGKLMANGEKFDRHKLTAAIWNVPFGTELKIVNLKNGKSVIVTVTDRGPHKRLHRAIDLSEAAARELDFIKQGLTEVFISRIEKPEFESVKISGELSGD